MTTEQLNNFYIGPSGYISVFQPLHEVKMLKSGDSGKESTALSTVYQNTPAVNMWIYTYYISISSYEDDLSINCGSLYGSILWHRIKRCKQYSGSLFHRYSELKKLRIPFSRCNERFWWWVAKPESTIRNSTQ